MSVYNGEKYLGEAIESILNQTYGNFEFIIINDGSRDKTQGIIDSYNDKRIKRIKNEENIGLVRSLNIGLRLVKGEFVARMDADDISYPERFEKQVRFLSDNEEVGVLGSAMENVDSKGNHLFFKHFPISHPTIFWQLFFENSVFHPTIMMRNSVIQKIGGYNEKFKHIEDTELWGRLIHETKFANLNDALLKRRVHIGSISSTQSKVQYRLRIELRRRLLKSVLGDNIPEGVPEWFADIRSTLKGNKLKNVRRVLVALYTYFICLKDLTKNDAGFIENDFVEKLGIIDRNSRYIVFRWLFERIKQIFPGGLTYSIKMKFINTFLKGRNKL